MRDMYTLKKASYFVVLTISCILISCGKKTEQEGFFPSSHTISTDLPKPSSSSVRARYKTFDREKILEKVSENKDYEALIRKAKDSVKDLIAKSDEELRAFIPPANTKRALMVNHSGCPICGGGTRVYAPFGTTIDLSLPLRVKCPKCGAVFPHRAEKLL